MKAKDKYNEQMQRLATESFKDHEITRSGYRRWHLKKPGTSCYWTEVIATANGVYVNGDVDVVVFGGGDHISGTDQVKWLGATKSFGYVVEKAQIGFSNRDIVYTYDSEVAADQIREAKNEYIKNGKTKYVHVFDEALDALEMGDLREQILPALYEHEDVWYLFDECSRIGDVVAPRIFYAHAALQKLHQLLTSARGERWCLECGMGECVCGHSPRWSNEP